MAATDATPFAIKNQAYLVYFTINDSNGRPVAGAGSLDSERSLDGAAFADCTNEAAEIGQGWYSLLMTATEVNTSCTLLVIKSDKETTFISIYPVEDGDIPVDATQVGGTAQTGGDLAALITTADAAIDVAVADLANGTDGLGALKTLIDTVDTVVDAIKVVTDKFAFTVANQVDANTLQIEGADATDQINAACDTAIADYDGPTRAELSSDIATVVTDLDDIKGTGFVKDTHSLIDIETYVDILDDGTSGNAKIATDVAAALIDTAVIGALGAGLSNIPWNASWDAEVQSEVNDALVALNLDHLVAVADADDVVDNSIIAKLANSGATADWSAYINTTDSLMAIRDHATTIKSETALIVADTNELQTDDVPGLIAALQDIAASDVLTQVNAALDTAITELGQGQPTATPTVRTAIMLLYMALRNKLNTQTSGTDALELHDDSGTRIAQKLLTDDGSDYSEAKMISGA
tara:strand:- start:4285 stop:5688 length:1404 start_codon:yes stop_codon:yes gene_type:complete